MDPSDWLPLQEPTFFILLSLGEERKHGYAILKDVEALSGGKISLSTGTLYGALSRLLDQGLIERSDDTEDGGHSSGGPGKPRKVYSLTHSGSRVLQAEINRMRSLLAVAARRLGEETP